ncbi:hypothetical protein SAMN05444144_10835 [Flavobacterium akiainvivens]|nr:hypothetical protein SAMN05444144_10835 [Flavobacterium akiainvivens]
MNRFFSAIFAGWGAKKLGGGCISTIIIFGILYYVFRSCG